MEDAEAALVAGMLAGFQAGIDALNADAENKIVCRGSVNRERARQRIERLGKEGA